MHAGSPSLPNLGTSEDASADHERSVKELQMVNNTVKF